MLENTFIPAGLQIDVPAMSDYFGLWAIHEPTFRNLVDRYRGLNLHAHISSIEAKQAVAKQLDADYDRTDDGIAVIRADGPLMKRASSLTGGTSMIRLRQQFRSAQQDPSVRGAVFILDTPGGTVKGNEDLCNEVARFAASKPVYAFVEDLCASGGVSVASQATKRFANNATALYGSMGTYAVLADQSGMADKLGVKVHVIKAGDYKGMGEPGSEITEQQLAEAQRIVNSLNDGYLNLIAKGLKQPLQRIKALADGRIHMAAAAVKMGLLDGVQSYEKTYADLVTATGGARKGSTNSGGAASAEARSGAPAWLEPAATAAVIIESFDSHVRELMASRGLSRRDACASLARRQPLLHEKFLGATTRRRRPS